jgi:peptide/nickel transport system permease protein
MTRLVVRRLVLAVPLLFAVSVLTFVLTALAPGDPAATILGASASPEKIAELRRQLGLDEPLWTQYWHWLSNAVHGNLGESLITSQSVTSALATRLPVTLSLVTCAALLASVLGVALGMFSALRGGFLGRATDVLAMFGFAIPNFWLGLVLVDLFAVQHRLLPATGYVSISDSLWGWLRGLVLPVITLAVVGITGITKQTRDAIRDVMNQDYIAALRADGVPESSIIFRHALRNAAIPIVTLIGVFFIGMLGGTVLVESVFVMPGLGSLAVSSAQTGDLPMLQGIVVVFCVIVIVANLLVDVIYGLLNPRVRVR